MPDNLEKMTVQQNKGRGKCLSVVGAILIAVGVSACSPGNTPPGTVDDPETLVDHFKFWQFDEMPATHPVKLYNQFDPFWRSWIPRKEQLETMNWIGNPVAKDGGSVLHPDTHLTAYYIGGRPFDEKILFRVKFRNQFGTATWNLSYSFMLLVPASKVLGQGTPPEPPRHDHYECYIAREDSRLARPTTLQDQFDRARDFVEHIEELEPAFFCLPVEKNGEDMVHPELHLALYDISPQHVLEPPIGATAGDQFGTHFFKAVSSIILAVPSVKLEWSERD